MSYYHRISGTRRGTELITVLIKDENGKVGPTQKGKLSNLRELDVRFSNFHMCECTRKARFHVTLCNHEFCGCCLKKTTALVSSESDESLDVFVCPKCTKKGSEVLSLMAQNDVFEFIFEKNICMRCFQTKVFGVTICNHGICCYCIRKLVDDLTIEKYQCPWAGCDMTYDLTSLTEMYTASLLEMAGELFQKPPYGSTCSSLSCRNMPVIGFKKCRHRWCFECIEKAPLSEENLENEDECLLKCPTQYCNLKFSKECLAYYIQQLKSTMQMTTFFLKPVESSMIGLLCSKCHQNTFEVLVEFQTCIHRVCLPCVHTILEEDTQRKKANFMGFPIEIMECPDTDCLKQIPIVCLKAMELALKGNLIGVSMFLKHPSRAGSINCSGCHLGEAYVGIVSCGHHLCLSCVKKRVSMTDPKKVAACFGTCVGIPIQCLKNVIEKPLQDILVKDNVDHFTELTRKTEKTETEECMLANSSARASRRSYDLLCPYYGQRILCQSCMIRMAVIIISTCSHGWCVDCLKHQIDISEKEKLQCKSCSSCVHTGNATRFLKTCEKDGLLIPAYIKPIPGLTTCNCKTNQAIFEIIECGHQFCIDCLLRSIAMKCSVLNHNDAEKVSTANTMFQTSDLQTQCAVCSKYELCMPMKTCHHIICKECVLRCFVCPIHKCGSIIDEASCRVLYDQINRNREELFITRLSKEGLHCSSSSCKKSYKKGSEIESMMQIRRCRHPICNQCFAKLQEDQNNLAISRCPSDQCIELFFLPPKLGSKDYDNQQNDNEIKAEGADSALAEKSSITRVENTKRQTSASYSESKKFTFPNLKYNEHEVETKGLPNLGLTCYRNSVYQILAESPGFFSKLKSSYIDVTEDWTFTLSEILWHILSKRSSKTHTEEYLLRMQQEFSAIDNSFREYGQNDSLSFLTSLLNNITGEIEHKRKKYSRSLQDPTDIFRGQIHDKYTCCKCKKTEYAGLSDFLSLPLPTINDKNPKIGQCLYKFFEAETLKGAVTCHHCKHDTVLKESVIKKFPDILVLQLGMVSEQQQHFSKVQRSPKFWENFKGLKNNIHRSKIDMKEFSKYTLFGVIVHIGGLSGGHYYTYVKRLDDDQWDLCDDSYVKRVDLKDVISCNAYVLFYHKCKRDTAC